MVVEAKKRFDQGEAGQDIGWYEWADEYIGLKETRLDELHSIGSDEDPLGRAREIRALANARVKKHREKKKAETPRYGNGEESKTASSSVPAAETASGDSAIRLGAGDPLK